MRQAKYKYNSNSYFKKWIRITSVVIILTFVVQDIARANPDILSFKKETLSPETLLAGNNKAEAFQKMAASYLNRALLRDDPAARSATLCNVEAMVPDLITQAKENGLADKDMPRVMGSALQGVIRIVFPNGSTILFYNPKIRTEIRPIKTVEINEYLHESVMTSQENAARTAEKLAASELKKPTKPTRSYKAQLKQLVKTDEDLRRMTAALLDSMRNNRQIRRLRSHVISTSSSRIRRDLELGYVKEASVEGLLSSLRTTSRWPRLNATQRNALDSVSARARRILEKKQLIAAQLEDMEKGLWKPYELSKMPSENEKREYLKHKTTETALKLEEVIGSLDERQINLNGRLMEFSGILRSWLVNGGRFPRDDLGPCALALHSISKMGREEGRGVVDYVEKTKVDRIGHNTRKKLFYIAESMYALVEASRAGEELVQGEFVFEREEQEGAPLGMIGWIWRPMIKRGWITRKGAAVVSSFAEELFFSLFMLNVVPMLLSGYIEVGAAHMVFLFLVSSFTYGFSHNYLFRWENSKELDFMPDRISWHDGKDGIFPDERATFADKLGFAALGAFFRIWYLVPGMAPAAGFLIALTLHILYNNLVAKKGNFPIGLSFREEPYEEEEYRKWLSDIETISGPDKKQLAPEEIFSASFNIVLFATKFMARHGARVSKKNRDRSLGEGFIRRMAVFSELMRQDPHVLKLFERYRLVYGEDKELFTDAEKRHFADFAGRYVDKLKGSDKAGKSAPDGMVGWLWRPLAGKGFISMETAARLSFFFEELVFAGVFLNFLPWFNAVTGFLISSDPFFLLVLSALSYSFSHDILYRWSDGKVIDSGPAGWPHYLGFAFIGAVFRSVYLIPGVSPIAGLFAAMGMHALYNNLIAPRFNFPAGMVRKKKREKREIGADKNAESVYKDYFETVFERNLGLFVLLAGRTKARREGDKTALERSRIKAEEAVTNIFLEIDEFEERLSALPRDMRMMEQHKRAVAGIRKAVRQIRADNEPAACAALVGAMNRISEAREELIRRRARRKRRKIKVFEDGHKIVMRSQRYVRPSEDAKTLILAYTDTEYGLRWQAGRSLDEQEDSLLEERSWILSVLQAPDIEELSGRLKGVEVEEKRMAKIVVEAVRQLEEIGEAGNIRHLLPMAVRYLHLRAENIVSMLGYIESGRVKPFREIVDRKNNKFLSTTDYVLSSLDKGRYKRALNNMYDLWKKMKDYIEEPDLEAMPSLVWAAIFEMKKLRKGLPRVQEDGTRRKAVFWVRMIRKKLEDSKKLAEFMAEFRPEYVRRKLEGDAPHLKEKVFLDTFEDFARKRQLVRGSPETKAFRMLCYLASFVPLEVKDPAKPSEKIDNPLVPAVNTLKLVVEVDDIDKLMRIKRLARMDKTREALRKLRKKRVIRGLNMSQQTRLVRAVAQDCSLTEEQRFELAKIYALNRKNLHRKYPGKKEDDPADRNLPTGMIGRLWDPLINSGLISRETAARFSFTLEEGFFAGVLLNLLPWLGSVTGFLALSDIVFLYIASVILYSASHGTLYRWVTERGLTYGRYRIPYMREELRVKQADSPDLSHYAGFAFIGAVFRAAYLIPGVDPLIALAAAMGLHALYNNLVASRFNLPVALTWNGWKNAEDEVARERIRKRGYFWVSARDIYFTSVAASFIMCLYYAAGGHADMLISYSVTALIPVILVAARLVEKFRLRKCLRNAPDYLMSVSDRPPGEEDIERREVRTLFRKILNIYKSYFIRDRVQERKKLLADLIMSNIRPPDEKERRTSEGISPSIIRSEVAVEIVMEVLASRDRTLYQPTLEAIIEVLARERRGQSDFFFRRFFPLLERSGKLPNFARALIDLLIKAEHRKIKLFEIKNEMEFFDETKEIIKMLGEHDHVLKKEIASHLFSIAEKSREEIPLVRMLLADLGFHIVGSSEFARYSAGRVAVEIRRLQEELNRPVNIVFSPGNTMRDFLEELAETPGIDWARVNAWQIAEFKGMTPEDPSSLARFLREKLFSKVDIPEGNIHYIDGANPDPAGYMSKIKAKGGADMFVLGVGSYGETAFNEPGRAPYIPGERASLVESLLSRETIKGKMGAHPSIIKEPYAYTWAMADIMKGEKPVFMFAVGEGKAEVVKNAFFGPITPDVPASLFQQHKNVTVILDSGAVNLIAHDLLDRLSSAIKDRKRTEQRYRDLFDHAPVGYLELDWNGNIVDANKTVADMLGYQPDEMLGASVFNFIPPDERLQAMSFYQAKMKMAREIDPFVRKYQKKDGSFIWMLVHDRQVVENGMVVGMRTTFEDITLRKELEDKLQQRDIIDDLTGAYNKRYMKNELPKLFEPFSRTGAPLSVIAVAIDGLDKIREQRGAEAEREAIRKTASLLRGCIKRTGDILIRYTNTDLLIVLPNATAEAADKMMAQRIMDGADDLLISETEGEKKSFTLSLGIASLRRKEGFASLRKRAEGAVLRAVNAGGNRVVIDPDRKGPGGNGVLRTAGYVALLGWAAYRLFSGEAVDPGELTMAGAMLGLVSYGDNADDGDDEIWEMLEEMELLLPQMVREAEEGNDLGGLLERVFYYQDVFDRVDVELRMELSEEEPEIYERFAAVEVGLEDLAELIKGKLKKKKISPEGGVPAIEGMLAELERKAGDKKGHERALRRAGVLSDILEGFVIYLSQEHPAVLETCSRAIEGLRIRLKDLKSSLTRSKTGGPTIDALMMMSVAAFLTVLFSMVVRMFRPEFAFSVQSLLSASAWFAAGVMTVTVLGALRSHFEEKRRVKDAIGAIEPLSVLILDDRADYIRQLKEKYSGCARVREATTLEEAVSIIEEDSKFDLVISDLSLARTPWASLRRVEFNGKKVQLRRGGEEFVLWLKGHEKEPGNIILYSTIFGRSGIDYLINKLTGYDALAAKKRARDQGVIVSPKSWLARPHPHSWKTYAVWFLILAGFFTWDAVTIHKYLSPAVFNISISGFSVILLVILGMTIRAALRQRSAAEKGAETDPASEPEQPAREKDRPVENKRKAPSPVVKEKSGAEAGGRAAEKEKERFDSSMSLLERATRGDIGSLEQLRSMNYEPYLFYAGQTGAKKPEGDIINTARSMDFSQKNVAGLSKVVMELSRMLKHEDPAQVEIIMFRRAFIGGRRGIELVVRGYSDGIDDVELYRSGGFNEIILENGLSRTRFDADGLVEQDVAGGIEKGVRIVARMYLPEEEKREKDKIEDAAEVEEPEKAEIDPSALPVTETDIEEFIRGLETGGDGTVLVYNDRGEGVFDDDNMMFRAPKPFDEKMKSDIRSRAGVVLQRAADGSLIVVEALFSGGVRVEGVPVLSMDGKARLRLPGDLAEIYKGKKVYLISLPGMPGVIVRDEASFMGKYSEIVSSIPGSDSILVDTERNRFNSWLGPRCSESYVDAQGRLKVPSTLIDRMVKGRLWIEGQLSFAVQGDGRRVELEPVDTEGSEKRWDREFGEKLFDIDFGVDYLPDGASYDEQNARYEALLNSANRIHYTIKRRLEARGVFSEEGIINIFRVLKDVIPNAVDSVYEEIDAGRMDKNAQDAVKFSLYYDGRTGGYSFVLSDRGKGVPVDVLQALAERAESVPSSKSSSMTPLYLGESGTGLQEALKWVRNNIFRMSIVSRHEGDEDGIRFVHERNDERSLSSVSVEDTGAKVCLTVPGDLEDMFIKREGYPFLRLRADIEANAVKSIIPMLANALVTMAERAVPEVPGRQDKKVKRVLAIDTGSVEGDELARMIDKYIIQALKKIHGNNGHFSEVLENLTIITGTGENLSRRLEAMTDSSGGEEAKISKENIVIVAPEKDIDLFEGFRGISFITAFDDSRLEMIDNTSLDYYPILEITLFAVLRALWSQDQAEGRQSMEHYRRLLLEWYRQIPNVKELNENAFRELCFDGQGRPRNTVVLKLIPNAEKMDARVLRDVYEAIEVFLRKA